MKIPEAVEREKIYELFYKRGWTDFIIKTSKPYDKGAEVLQLVSGRKLRLLRSYPANYELYKAAKREGWHPDPEKSKDTGGACSVFGIVAAPIKDAAWIRIRHNKVKSQKIAFFTDQEESLRDYGMVDAAAKVREVIDELKTKWE